MALRIVMLGKTGTGKSATGNTILGQECFESKLSAISMTEVCALGEGTVDGQKVAIIDSPGLFDTRFGMDKTAKDVTQCVTFSLPGPHVFLVVIRLGRYTAEEMNTVQRIQDIFGQAADRYSMVLFTGGDQLEIEDMTIEDFLAESSELQELVARCNGQYHVFNNKSRDHTQVTVLLQKIRNLIQWNGGSHYTSQMFQEAERALEEEKQRIQREKEEQQRKEREELDRKMKAQYEEQMKKLNEQLQAEREREREERERERQREIWQRERDRRKEREEREAEMRRLQEEREREIENMQREQERALQEERERLESSGVQARANDGCTIQ